MIIFLDLDGVLHNNDKEVCKILGLDYNNQQLRNSAKGDYEFFEKSVGSDVYADALINGGSEFWENLELYSWSKPLYDGCCEVVGKDNVFFLSSFGKFLDAATVKAKRIKKEFNSSNGILTHFKYLLAAPDRVLIDDKPKNIQMFEACGGNGILWPHPFYFLDGDFDIDLYLKRTINTLYGFKQAPTN